MALDATVGGEDSNSYVTQAEATAYFADRLHADSWEDFASKDQALITASSMLDWNMKWKGFRSSSSQKLDWPRSGVLDSYSVEIDSDTLPDALKVATFEMALSILEEDRSEDWDLSGFKSVKVDVIEVTADDSINNPKPSIIPTKVNRILRGLIMNSSSRIRTAFLVRR